MASGNDYANRRDFIRMFVDATVTFRIPGEPECYSGQTTNLSGSGLLFVSPIALQEAQVIEFSLGSAQSRLAPLEGELRVVRVKPAGDGQFEIAGEMIKVR